MTAGRLKYLIIPGLLFCFTGRIFSGDGHLSPHANFEMNGFCWGSVTNFTNTSTDLQNYAFQWTIIQQGISTPIYTSTNTNISFQFPVKTNYTVTLNVKNYVTATHFHQDDATRFLTLESFPIANFDYAFCRSQFINLSCCTNTSLWDFGDNSPSSTLTNPVHTYTALGNYTVTLISGNGTVNDTFSQTITVNADVLTGSFTINSSSDTTVFTTADLKNYDDSLKAAFWDWEWDFGDGASLDVAGDTGWQVKHYYQRYENDSVYTVTLLLKDICFEAEFQKNIRIKGTGRTVTGTHVFPSPVVHGYLNVETDDISELKEINIIDCLGRKLDGLVPSAKRYGYYIYIGPIPAGVYIVQLIFGNRIENHKIIKQ